MAEEWAINGHRVVRHTSMLGGGKLVVLDASGAETNRLVLERGTEWELPVGSRTWRIARRRVTDGIGRTMYRIDVLSEREEPVPPGVGSLLQPVEAPPGSQCSVHGDVTAARACARCGCFVCEGCLAADAVRCSACFAPIVEAHAKEQSAAFWGAPAVLFLYGGPLGFALGGLAAVAAMAYARRTPRERFSAWVPAGLYLAAMGLWLVALRLLRA